MPSNTFRSIGVFASSAIEVPESWSDFAYSLGRFMAESGIKLIFGGTDRGLMSRLCSGALDNGGKVVGIISRNFIDAGLPLPLNLKKMIVTATLAERKMLLINHSDQLIALPGGIGTLDEIFEVLSHNIINPGRIKPLLIVNLDHFYDDLLTHFRKMIELKITSDFQTLGLNVVESSDGCMKQIKQWILSNP